MKLLTATVLLVAVAAAGTFFWMHDSPEAKLEDQWAFVESYCVDCHNDADFTGGFSFEGLGPDDIHAKAGLFEETIRKLRIGMMPPRDVAQPEPAQKAEFLAALESTLDAAVADEPYAGETSVHRLNRAEYANAIRDLLDVEVDVIDLLPSDGGDFGFDNIASVLRTNPLLLERYLTVALRVSALAVGDTEALPSEASYKIPPEISQKAHLDGLPLGTRGGIVINHTFPADAEYVFAGRLLRTVAEGYVGVEGHDTPHTFVVTVDGEQVFSAPIGGEADHEESADNITISKETIDRRMTSQRIPVSAGPHELAFTWIDRPAFDQSVWQPAIRDSLEAHNPAGLPRLETAIIQGPYNVSGVSDTPSRDRIFVCTPQSAEQEDTCAREIFQTLARRAFRRPVNADDIAAPLEFYASAREEGGNFDSGIRDGVARLLVSPSFLFRVEQGPADLAPGSVHEVSDIELASRLSFFLWSSIPDDELIDEAAAGRLSDPQVLESQVSRMLADERSSALVANFTGQWLQLRNLELRVKPDLLMFPDFDGNLREAFRQETEMLFGHVLREGKSVLELLDADYTFANERLARHYGIPGVYGDQFRRVDHVDDERHGLLGHGSLLALTSASSRTSPIIRGKYLMSNILNSPPPPPPDVVPALEESAPKDRPSTVREQLERHRADPVCASCHRNLDPLGFALENFDATGKWRTHTREGLPIDSAGILADGTPVDGPRALRQALLAKPEVFASTVTEKLMIYALGRGLEPADMPQVRRILRNTEDDNYRLQSIILGIVDSYPFRMRTNPDPSDALETVAQVRE